MRTTPELIQELEEEAKNFTMAAIAVGFESTTVFVFANDPNRLEKLNDAIRAGGEPVGLLAFNLFEGQLAVHSRPLAEYAEETWAPKYLHNLCDTFGKLVLQNHGGQIQHGEPPAN